MESPLILIKQWINEEKELGDIFPRGAVLSTISASGNPTSRVVGTMFDKNLIPKFFTSPNSRKIDNININNSISLTYSFSNTLRSISIEGSINTLTSCELNKDWLEHDEDFRKHYLVFGKTSGDKIESINSLKEDRDKSTESTKIRPDSFIGYKFEIINRISFYTVKENDFAINDIYEWDKVNEKWVYSLFVP